MQEAGEGEKRQARGLSCTGLSCLCPSGTCAYYPEELGKVNNGNVNKDGNVNGDSPEVAPKRYRRAFSCTGGSCLCPSGTCNYYPSGLGQGNNGYGNQENNGYGSQGNYGSRGSDEYSGNGGYGNSRNSGGYYWGHEGTHGQMHPKCIFTVWKRLLHVNYAVIISTNE